MKKIAEFMISNGENNSAADQRGTTAPSESGEHVILGGPRAVAGREQIVMGSNMGSPVKAKRAALSELTEVANFFRFVRCALELTQEEMAKRVQCDPRSWGRWERAETEPGASVYRRVAALHDGLEASKRRTA